MGDRLDGVGAFVGMRLLLGVSIFFNFFCFGGTAVTCKNEKGLPVDWFVIYKYPRDEHSSNALLRAGLGHAYLDVDRQSWVMSDESLNGTNHAIYFTLQQIYDTPATAEDVMYMLYNDETPEKKVTFTHGHTKGDVCFDGEQGFWLVHSLPRFPDYVKSGYTYPHSGIYFGQTFLCMTLPTTQLEIIAKAFYYTFPLVYDHLVPKKFLSEYPMVQKIISGKEHVTESPWNFDFDLKTIGGRHFHGFAKFTKFGKDLYDAWVAPWYQSPLLVESWQNGPKKLPSNCSARYNVKNIQRLNVDGEPFHETVDHSKWAVTAQAKAVICIGDINRAASQEHRAGATVCSHLPQVWHAFNQSVVQVQPC